MSREISIQISDLEVSELEEVESVNVKLFLEIGLKGMSTTGWDYRSLCFMCFVYAHFTPTCTHKWVDWTDFNVCGQQGGSQWET